MEKRIRAELGRARSEGKRLGRPPIAPALEKRIHGDSVADEVGEEFDVVEAARAHAIAVARELSGNRVPDALVGLYISVVDERGVAVFKVPL
jgi:hypothetical protein